MYAVMFMLKDKRKQEKILINCNEAVIRFTGALFIP